MSSHNYTGCQDQACPLCHAYREGYSAGKDDNPYNRDYHKFADCPWTGVNDPMCWICLRYVQGIIDYSADMVASIANGVRPDDSPFFRSVQQRRTAWTLKVEMAKWELGGYPDREGHIRDCQGAGCGATCVCPCHAGELRG